MCCDIFKMVDGFLIAITIILTIILIAGNIWLMFYYLDDSEMGFGDSWVCKVLI